MFATSRTTANAAPKLSKARNYRRAPACMSRRWHGRTCCLKSRSWLLRRNDANRSAMISCIDALAAGKRNPSQARLSHLFACSRSCGCAAMQLLTTRTRLLFDLILPPALCRPRRDEHRQAVNLRAPELAIEGLQLLAQTGQHLRQHRIDPVQRMADRNALFEVK